MLMIHQHFDLPALCIVLAYSVAVTVVNSNMTKEICGDLGVLMSIPRALYWTLNQGNSAKHQLYREVAVEELRNGLK